MTADDKMAQSTSASMALDKTLIWLLQEENHKDIYDV